MVKRIRRIPKIPGEAELNKVIDTIKISPRYSPNNKGTFLRWRDLTAMRLDFYSGMRPGEFLNLRWLDIDFINRVITVQPYFNKQKVGNTRTLSVPLAKYLEEYKFVCSQLGIYCEFIIPSLDTLQPLSVDRWSRIFTQFIKDAGIARVEFYTDNGQPRYNYRPYSGRHWFGTQILKATNSVPHVAKTLGQLSPFSAMIYTHIDDTAQHDAVDKAFPE